MSVEIKINDEFMVTSDDRNFILRERYFTDPTKAPNFNPEEHDATPKEKWRDIAYCKTLQHALEYYVDRSIKTSNCTSISQLRALIAELNAEIQKI
jgi:hypothetical protein